MSDPHAELTRLRELERELGADVALELVDLFLEDTPGQFTAMHDALAGGQAEALRRSAHSLKGSCSNLGLDTLSQQAGELELHVRDNGCAEVGERVNSLEGTFQQLLAPLGHYRDELKAGL